jgi:hypothetical protein
MEPDQDKEAQQRNFAAKIAEAKAAGGTLENAQAMAARESPRTTKLYDRIGDEITLDEIEWVKIDRFPLWSFSISAT